MISKFFTLCLIFVVVPCAIALDHPQAAPAKPIVLLTGFEPFGGSSFNTSWDVASTFDGQEIAGHWVKVVKLRVVYDKIDGPLAEAIEKWKPDVVISFGEGTREIHVEKVARNGYHPMKPRDNERNPPPRENIVPGGAGTIATGLPAEAILAKLKAAAIPAAASTDAGGYLCNECFYRLMSIKSAPAKRGFVHVPVVPPTDEAGRKRLAKAVGIIVETAISAK